MYDTTECVRNTRMNKGKKKKKKKKNLPTYLL